MHILFLNLSQLLMLDRVVSAIFILPKMETLSYMPAMQDVFLNVSVSCSCKLCAVIVPGNLEVIKYIYRCHYKLSA